MIRRSPRDYELELADLELAPRAARVQFERDGDDLIDKWAAIKTLSGAQRIESPNAWFKRNAYRFLKRYVDAKRVQVFERAIHRSKRHNVGINAIRDNPFKLGLYAIFSDTSLSRSDRHVFGNQMLYAHRHGVPPEHLAAFIRAAGSPNIIAQKLNANVREPFINFG